MEYNAFYALVLPAGLRRLHIWHSPNNARCAICVTPQVIPMTHRYQIPSYVLSENVIFGGWNTMPIMHWYYLRGYADCTFCIHQSMPIMHGYHRLRICTIGIVWPMPLLQWSPEDYDLTSENMKHMHNWHCCIFGIVNGIV